MGSPKNKPREHGRTVTESPPRQYLTASQESCQAQCSLFHSVSLLELSVFGLLCAFDGDRTVQGSTSEAHCVDNA